MNARTSASAAPDRSAGSFQLSLQADGSLAARGPLTFASARAALAQGQAALAGAAGRTLELDCHGVGDCDSAGLAVLLEWLAMVRRAGSTLGFRRLPPGLVALARISEVETLLGV